MEKINIKKNSYNFVLHNVKKFKLLNDKIFSKSLGQNFLFNEEILKKIVDAANISENDIIIEIGPGPLGLTKYILENHPQKLFLIEKDLACVNLIKTLITEKNVFVHNDDALKFNFNNIFLNYEDVKIISNLPYNVGTKIFTNFFKFYKKIKGMTLMFQEEVTNRIIAEPGNHDYGRLSIISKFFGKAEKILTVSPENFVPQPKIFSSVINFKFKNEVEIEILETLEKITKKLFEQRRKIIKNRITEFIEISELKNFGINENFRPENLTLENFLEISRFVYKKNNS